MQKVPDCYLFFPIPGCPVAHVAATGEVNNVREEERREKGEGGEYLRIKPANHSGSGNHEWKYDY
jgi:hypothetical protein